MSKAWEIVQMIILAAMLLIVTYSVFFKNIDSGEYNYCVEWNQHTRTNLLYNCPYELGCRWSIDNKGLNIDYNNTHIYIPCSRYVKSVYIGTNTPQVFTNDVESIVSNATSLR